MHKTPVRIQIRIPTGVFLSYHSCFNKRAEFSTTIMAPTLCTMAAATGPNIPKAAQIIAAKLITLAITIFCQIVRIALRLFCIASGIFCKSSDSNTTSAASTAISVPEYPIGQYQL